MPAMIRKQVYLTPELDERLRREAARQQRSEAEILREALAAQLGARDEAPAGSAQDSLWDLVGIGAAEEDDLSEHVDDALYGPTSSR